MATGMIMNRIMNSLTMNTFMQSPVLSVLGHRAAISFGSASEETAWAEAGIVSFMP